MKNETALNEYLFDLKLRNCSPRTVRSAKNNMALFLCWLETEYNLTAISRILSRFISRLSALQTKPRTKTHLYQ